MEVGYELVYYDCFTVGNHCSSHIEFGICGILYNCNNYQQTEIIAIIALIIAPTADDIAMEAEIQKAVAMDGRRLCRDCYNKAVKSAAYARQYLCDSRLSLKRLFIKNGGGKNART